MHLQQCTWSPRLEVDGAAIPWTASVRDFQRGHASHVGEALEQPLLLPKDMDALRKMRQQDLFMSLKRDLALVSALFDIFLLDITMFFSSSFFFFFSHFFFSTYNCYVVLMQITQEVFVVEEWVKDA